MEPTEINIDDNQEPAFGYTLSIINGKWKLLIIYHLSKAIVIRYKEHQRSLRKRNHTTHRTTLKAMVNDEIIHREEYPQAPPKVEYSLTKKGHPPWPILQDMCQWGEYHQ